MMMNELFVEVHNSFPLVKMQVSIYIYSLFGYTTLYHSRSLAVLIQYCGPIITVTTAAFNRNELCYLYMHHMYMQACALRYMPHTLDVTTRRRHGFIQACSQSQSTRACTLSAAHTIVGMRPAASYVTHLRARARARYRDSNSAKRGQQTHRLFWCFDSVCGANEF